MTVIPFDPKKFTYRKIDADTLRGNLQKDNVRKLHADSPMQDLKEDNREHPDYFSDLNRYWYLHVSTYSKFLKDYKLGRFKNVRKCNAAGELILSKNILYISTSLEELQSFEKLFDDNSRLLKRIFISPDTKVLIYPPSIWWRVWRHIKKSFRNLVIFTV